MQARHRTPSKIAEMQSVSQIPGSAGAIGRNCFLGKSIKPASRRISLDGRVEAVGFKNFEPRTKTCQLLRSQLLDSFFDFFSGCHSHNIAFDSVAEKVRD
jgi:hypothetical protein